MGRCPLAARFLTGLFGAALILRGTGAVALGLIGETATAAITHVRRQGGERDDTRPGRYTYIVSYSFALPDGTVVDGSTTRIGDGVYVDSPGTTSKVKYLASFPAISALEQDTRPGPGQLLMVAAGLLLLCLPWTDPRRSARVGPTHGRPG